MTLCITLVALSSLRRSLFQFVLSLSLNIPPFNPMEFESLILSRFIQFLNLFHSDFRLYAGGGGGGGFEIECEVS
ncbi:hypothetical protein LguiA_009257 [Lonicera macranthoides]